MLIVEGGIAAAKPRPGGAAPAATRGLHCRRRATPEKGQRLVGRAQRPAVVNPFSLVALSVQHCDKLQVLRVAGDCQLHRIVLRLLLHATELFLDVHFHVCLSALVVSNFGHRDSGRLAQCAQRAAEL